MTPIEGVDYSYDPPTPADLVAAGKRFAVRYGALGNPAKHLTAAEVAGLTTAGLSVVANVEETARAYTGAAAGAEHARAGDAFFRRLGMPPDRPIYFSVDWDAQPADWPGIDAALRASAAVLGADRVGVYGGYDTIEHCAQAGTAAWFWQTYAWSGGRWHPSCHLQQYQNNISLGAGTVDLTRAVTSDYGQWGGAPPMAMDPRTHPRGAAPNFSMAGLPANPNPKRITSALWWLVQMRLRLEPLSKNGGILAIKPGYHSYGSRLPDHGLGDSATDHSIRRAPDRTGPWWQGYASAHDWTFDRAHTGNYTEINKYCVRLRNAMRDPNDLRPDDVYAYFIGQIDSDNVVEGYNEYRDGEETGDDSHLWHRHDSFRRNIVGDFWAMWKALTIDMGWTYAEWQRSVQKEEDMPLTPADADMIWNRDTIKNPKQRGDSPSSGGTNADTAAEFALGDMWQLLYNQRDAMAALATTVTNLGKQLTATQQALTAVAGAVTQARTENTAQEAATATLVRQLTDLVRAGGGDVETATVVAKLEEVQTEITQAAQRAGNAASHAVMDHMRRAAAAEVAVLTDTAEGLDNAVRDNPPKG